MSLRRALPTAARVLLATLAVAGAVGCGDDGERPAGSTGAGASAGDPPPATSVAADGPRDTTPDRPLPNIVVYLVDTLRADRLGLYGYERETSPFLDKLAGEAVVFEQAIAQAPWTLPSTTSLFTSTYPQSHQVFSGQHVVSEEVETMVEFMRSLGYHTLGFVSNPLGGSGAGLDQGYDEYFQRPPQRDITDEMRAQGLHTMRPLFDMVEAIDGDRPFFLYVHTVEPHWPYEGNPREAAPFHDLTDAERDRVNVLVEQHRMLLQRQSVGNMQEGDAERLVEVTAELLPRIDDVNALYDGDVRRADDFIARLHGTLRYHGHWDDTVFILLSDHGEEMLDHGLWFHDQSLYQDLVHVPLVMRLPGDTDAGLRIAEPVQVIDILPTLADYLGVDPLPFWQGRSLLPLLRDETREPGPPVLAMRNNVDRLLGGERGDRESAIVSAPYKLIVHHDAETVSLFDLEQDPAEQHDLSEARPDEAAALRQQLIEVLRVLRPLDIRRIEAIDDEKLQHLRELGYVEDGD